MNKQTIMRRPKAALALLAFDAAAALAVAATFSCAFATPAYAYVDPSVMTYAIQAIAGVAVALSTVLGVVLRRTRRKLFAALGIDENAHKEVEARIHRVDAAGKPVVTKADARADYLASGKAAKRERNRASSLLSDFSVSWKKRAVFAFVVSLFFSFTLCVSAPFELVWGSSGSLVVHLGDITGIMAVTALIVTALLTVVLTCLRGNVFRVCALVVFALGLCFYVQALFLNGGLPQADGHAVDWGDYTFATVLSGAVWIVLFAAAIGLGLRFRKQTQIAVGALAVALVIVQGTAAARLLVSNAQAEAKGANQVVTTQGLFDVSSENNVVEFVLDNYDTELLKQGLAQEPGMLDEFTGFTWFPDSVGSMIPTRYGNVFLLTGEYPEPGEKFSTFLDQRYDRSTYLEDIKQAGYSIGIYSDTLGENEMTTADPKSQIYELTENIHTIDPNAIDKVQTSLALLQCALYRDVTWIAKPFFWFYTDEINNRVIVQSDNAAASHPYTMNDARYYQTLKSSGLSINNEQASYRYIHILGAHDPFILNREAEEVGAEATSQLDQSIGAMGIVSEYLRQLKELGLYDKTTVVVTTDHGEWFLQDSDLAAPKSSILLVKPAETAEEAAAPLSVSAEPVMAGNILGTVIGAVGADTSGYAPSLFSKDLADANATRYFYMTTSNGVHDQEIQQYAITGDVSSIANWKRTDNVWAAQE